MGDSIGVWVRRVGLAGSLALVAAGFGELGLSSGSARTIGVSATMKPVSASEKWIRVFATGGDALDLFAVQGVDFSIVRVASVRASGVPAPACSVTGVPATLTCVGHVRSGASVFVNVTTAGAGGTFQFARASAGGAIDLVDAPAMSQGSALLPIAARMTRRDGRKTVIFSGQTTFQDVEILPTSAFRVGNVTSVTVAGKARSLRSCRREGDGLDCRLVVPTGSIGKITFTAPRTNARTIYGLPGPKDSVEIVLHTDGQVGDHHVVEAKS
jgi:hypothetical protein